MMSMRRPPLLATPGLLLESANLRTTKSWSKALQKLLLKRRSSRVTNRNLFKDLNSDDHQSPPGVSPRDSPSVRRVVAPSAADKTNAGVVSREDPNRIALSSPRGRDRARSVPQEGGLPPPISRPQRRRTPPEVLLEAHIDQPPVSRENRIPPIVLREKSGWCDISAEIRRKGLNFLKAQNIAEGIRVFHTGESDFRGIVKFFTNEKIPFHTYQLPSEKGLNVVMRAPPSEIPEDQIQKHLRELGFSPDSRTEKHLQSEGAGFARHFCRTPKSQPNNWTVLPLSERYGHAQSRCTAGDTHPANYRGCTRCPKPRAAPSRAVQTPKRTDPTTSKIQPGKSFSQAVAAPTWTATQSRLRESQTPKVRNAPPPRSRPKGQTTKAVILDPEPSRGANIVSMLAALQKLTEQISQVALTCQKLLQINDNSGLDDVSDDGIGEDELVNARYSECSEVFDIESIPIIFNQGSSLSEDGELENASWDSDDESPLSVIRSREI
ncbi:hypothetical protein QE152_g40340 [Popillia japonica]|uniref:Uncharacterized protein n=1 Tax=Popillia japonica TaxID=7064 RepID=A0AAW1HRM7_POPJA